MERGSWNRKKAGRQETHSPGYRGEEAGDREILDPALVYPGEILEEEDVKLAGEEGFFAINPIDDYIFGRMDGSSYREGCPVAREDLRYLLILHYDFSGNIRVGELVCHKSVSEDMKRIFLELYKAEYPIEKVVLVDDYGGDDDWSSRDNNTSCLITARLSAVINCHFMDLGLQLTSILCIILILRGVNRGKFNALPNRELPIWTGVWFSPIK